MINMIDFNAYWIYMGTFIQIMLCISYANRGLNVLDTVTTVNHVINHAAIGILSSVLEVWFTHYQLWLNAILQLTNPFFHLSWGTFHMPI